MRRLLISWRAGRAILDRLKTLGQRLQLLRHRIERFPLLRHHARQVFNGPRLLSNGHFKAGDTAVIV